MRNLLLTATSRIGAVSAGAIASYLALTPPQQAQIEVIIAGICAVLLDIWATKAKER